MTCNVNLQKINTCVCVYFCIALSQMLMLLCVASKLCYVNVCLRDFSHFSDVNAMHCYIFNRIIVTKDNILCSCFLNII